MPFGLGLYIHSENEIMDMTTYLLKNQFYTFKKKISITKSLLTCYGASLNIF